MTESDFSRFLEQECEIWPKLRGRPSVLFNAYLRWSGETSLDPKKFYRALWRRFDPVVIRGKRSVVGVDLREEARKKVIERVERTERRKIQTAVKRREAKEKRRARNEVAKKERAERRACKELLDKAKQDEPSTNPIAFCGVLTEFVRERCEQGPYMKESLTELYREYLDWLYTRWAGARRDEMSRIAFRRVLGGYFTVRRVERLTGFYGVRVSTRYSSRG